MSKKYLTNNVSIAEPRIQQKLVERADKALEESEVVGEGDKEDPPFQYNKRTALASGVERTQLQHRQLPCKVVALYCEVRRMTEQQHWK